MKIKTRQIIIIVLIILLVWIISCKMKEMYEESVGPTPEVEEETEVEEDPEIKKKIEESEITQEDLDALVGLL